MPSGKTHDKINFMLLPIFIMGMVSIGFFSILFAVVFSVGFAFGTLLMGPDLDIKSKLWRRWGVFKFIWTPYQRLFPHRSIYTHGFIIGDIIRFLFLMVWISLLLMIPSYIASFFEEELTHAVYYCLVIALLMVLLNIIGKGFIKNKIKKVYKKNRTGFTISLLMAATITLSCLHIFPLHAIVYKYYSLNPYAFLFFPLGVVLASSLHTVTDIVVSSARRFSNRYIYVALIIIIISYIAYMLSPV